MKNFRTKKILGFFFFLAVFAGVTAIVMLLWNALLPAIIGWSAINYWQAAGLIILSRLLIGGLGGFRHMHHGFHGKHHHHFSHANMREFHDMKKMSHEDRREYIRRRMAGFSHTGEEPDMDRRKDNPDNRREENNNNSTSDVNNG